MKQVSDRKKQRREYLAKKAKTIIPAVIAGFFIILLDGFILKLAVQRNTMSDSQFAAFVLTIILITPCAIIIIRCEKKRLSLPYVPPVTADNLPAEEVLVRGSEEPSVKPSDTLLRATKEQDTAREELLRTSSA